MIEKPIDRLESQLQTLIEGAFARLFRSAVSARDIAVLLLRAMEDHAAPPLDSGSQRLAPDSYQIFLHPETAKHFISQYPDISTRLAALILELGAQSGYQLHAPPQVELLADGQLAEHQAIITASHSVDSSRQTTAVQPATAAPPQRHVHQPALYVVNETKSIPLSKSLINIGRENSNDIVIKDAYISRHHLQLRKRFGAYTLFDVHSRGGTLVNDTAVREHRLQNGDVIRIGHTRLVYTDAQRPSHDTTQILDPV